MRFVVSADLLLNVETWKWNNGQYFSICWKYRLENAVISFQCSDYFSPSHLLTSSSPFALLWITPCFYWVFNFLLSLYTVSHFLPQFICSSNTFQTSPVLLVSPPLSFSWSSIFLGFEVSVLTSMATVWLQACYRTPTFFFPLSVIYIP